MNPQDDHPNDWQGLRKKIIGLGEKSIRKSYYPELRQRLTDFENFYTLMNHVSDAILIFDVDTLRITDANRAACALAGNSVKEMRLLTLPQICPDILITEPQPSPSVTRFLSIDKDEIPIELTSQVLRSAETTQGVVIARDIRERIKAEELLKKSENRYRQFFNENVSGAYISSPDGVILAANPAFVKMLGFETVEELLSLNMKFLFEDSNSHQEFLNAIKHHKRLRHHPATLVGKNGEKIYVIENVSGLFTKTGEVEEIRGYVMDLSEQKRLESRLYQSSKMEAIGTLAGGIAHDFNNLLMGIQGRTSLISFDLEISHPHLEHTNAIEEYIRSATNLTRQLLGFARGGKYEVKPVDMNELVLSSSAMFGRTKKEIRIHTKCEKSSLVVEADRGQIEQVLLNIYVNAWQAMPPDGGELYLETKIVSLDETYCNPHQAEPGRYVKVSITDTGAGMNEATRQRIFDPFFTTKEMGRGTGLGLASAYGIIKNHGGMITVYSEVGHGTTFNIYLPLSDKESHRKASAETALIKGSATILLVDDEELIIDVGQAILERLGYRVIVSRGGQEAVNVIKDMGNEIDLVILDMIMPEMDGGKTFDCIREIQPGMPVLLSSGYAINGHADKIMRRGCNGFIQKPYSLSEISNKVRNVLDEVKGTPQQKFNNHKLITGEF